MAFLHPQAVLFRHCDPAGIVFYPRYFEMLNDCVEAFFDTELGLPFAELHKAGGVPTAQISATFHQPSRHGDSLVIALSVTRVGRSSLDLTYRVTCDGAPRLTATGTLVLVGATGSPAPWPDKVRQSLLDREETPAHDT